MTIRACWPCSHSISVFTLATIRALIWIYVVSISTDLLMSPQSSFLSFRHWTVSNIAPKSLTLGTWTNVKSNHFYFSHTTHAVFNLINWWWIICMSFFNMLTYYPFCFANFFTFSVHAYLVLATLTSYKRTRNPWHACSTWTYDQLRW